MSGANLAQHTQAAPAQPATVDATEDYAASLRAAALMTLKSKRRKVNVSQAEPIPPQRTFAAPPSIELDYGQEEPTGTSSIASSPVMAPAKPAAPPPPVDEPMDIDPSPAREEGEISDSEEAPPSPKAKIEPQSPTLVKAESATQIVPPKMNLSPAPPSPAALASVPNLELPHISAASALVDENHVRPGLALTQAQYDTAKDIVLDLLGWGVPPEYLVDCGLSREIVYYVFVELNLRLPSNLDTTGLPLPAPSLSSQLSHPSTSATRASLTHPSLPPKPRPDSTPTLHALSASAAPFVPTISDAASSSASDTPDSTLNDMEQQRRQELLARKAVLASRKAKRKAPASHSVNTTSTAHQPVASGNVPLKAVDDFLQSIEPAAFTVSDTPAATVASRFTQPASRPDAFSMEVDDVPGLTTAYDPTTEYTPLPRPPPGRPQPIKSALSPESTTSQSPAVPNSAVSTVSDRSFNPPSSAASIGGTPQNPGEIDDDMDAVPGLFRPRSLPDSEQPAPRRGTKRPVAADFVDMDSGPAQASVKGTNPDFFRANIRRKTAGFAGLTQRRCIIDLSDSEDEDSIPRFNGVYSRIESRGTKPSTPQVTVAPTPRTHSPAVAPSATPSALQKAEEEIRQLHEAIAQRRRKKKPVASSQPTPTSEMSTNGVSIKQEDDDSTGFGIRSFDPSRSTSSATPDPTANGRPNDSQDERSVLATLLPREPSQNGTVSLPASASSSNSTTPIGPHPLHMHVYLVLLDPLEPTPQLLEHPTTGDKGKCVYAVCDLSLSHPTRSDSRPNASPLGIWSN
ncbi:hypothetical protein BD413DRAFT_64835 [Trametes elegans]|nr:hypothetical protein BD413DRAFT_64835 [Trametes elegans]